MKQCALQEWFAFRLCPLLVLSLYLWLYALNGCVHASACASVVRLCPSQYGTQFRAGSEHYLLFWNRLPEFIALSNLLFPTIFESVLRCACCSGLFCFGSVLGSDIMFCLVFGVSGLL